MGSSGAVLLSLHVPLFQFCACVSGCTACLQEMMYRGCERSVITYSSLISACEKAGQVRLNTALELDQLCFGGMTSLPADLLSLRCCCVCC
jgi:hypothetical protein